MLSGRAYLCLFLALFLASCSDDESLGVNAFCSSAIECGTGEFCVNAVCAVPNPATCSPDVVCGDQFECVAGHCVAAFCQVQEDCGDGATCEDNHCRQLCVEDGDCADQKVCSLQGTCLDEVVCDPPCGARQYCNPENLQCLSRGCANDDECGRGRICDDGDCAAGCRADEHCGIGSLCTDLSCEPGCRNNAGCSAIEICVEGHCTLGCDEDDDCGLGDVCEDALCQAGCRTDVDCPMPGVCDNGTCRVVCDNDDFEPNNAEGSASEVGLPSAPRAVVCDGDEDRYRLRPVPGCLLSATLTSDDTDGELDLSVIDATNQVVGTSTSPGSHESATLRAEDAYYDVRIYPTGAVTGDGAMYQLNLTCE